MNEKVEQAFDRIREKAWHDEFFTREDVSRERAIRWADQLKEDIEIVEKALNDYENELSDLRKFAKLFTRDRLHDGCRINNYDTNPVTVDWGLLFQMSEDEHDFYNQEADKYGKEN